MELDRRELLLTGGALLAGCRGAAELERAGDAARLDALFAANSAALPEASTSGANHYSMAGEALDALGAAQAIPDEWITRAVRYGAAAPVAQELGGALGDPARYEAWLAHFRAALASCPWRAVVAREVPVLAPGLAGAAWHGLLRTAHAVRALRRRDNGPRREELAAGLAYWAARYTELPPSADGAPTSFAEALQGVEHPWADDPSDVDFAGVTPRLVAAPATSATPATPATRGLRLDAPVGAAVEAALTELVRATATAFQEMLVQERHRIWALHAVTGPAAVGLLTPDLEGDAARALVAHAGRAALATHSAFGAPFEPRAHVRPSPPSWPTLVAVAAERRSVHTAKLIEALYRSDKDGDPLWRSVAETWLEWR